MNLSPDEEKLIRAIRIADFQTALRLYEEMKAKRIAEDHRYVRDE